MSSGEATKEAAIDRLAILQELDRQLKAKQEQVDALVAQAVESETRLADQRGAVARFTAEQTRLDSERRDLEARLEDEGGKIRDSRMRMNRVRTDREMLALQRQIELGREAIQQLEEQLLVVLENLEAVAAGLAEAEAAVKDLEGNASSEASERRQEAEALEQALAADRSRRNQVADGIDPGLRSKYEQLFDRRGGTAVVEVRQGTCLGCHMNVPPQLFNEVQRYRDVRQCPNCHRIIYWRPGGNDDAP